MRGAGRRIQILLRGHSAVRPGGPPGIPDQGRLPWNPAPQKILEKNLDRSCCRLYLSENVCMIILNRQG